MRFKSFRFVNFRGIKDTTLDLARRPNGHINALVGLNESGKTTVLEGIHHFLSNPDLLRRAPSSASRTPKDCQKMLPISMRALFNGKIVIKATVEIEESDWKKIDAFLKNEFGFKKTQPETEFSISHELSFQDSNIASTLNNWGLNFIGHKSGKGNRKAIYLKGADWLKAAKHVQEMLPQIVYFPSTLLEFPDRIVLENAPEKAGKNKGGFPFDVIERRNDFYCSVLEDVLRAIDPSLKLNEHLVSRANSVKKSDKENLDALLLLIEKHLKKTVFSEWQKIFEHAPNVDFKVSLTTENEQLGLEIKILTDEGKFSINERSAGFRWFFAFIMLTRYRLHRKDRVLFLFDEPAANLHPNAQQQLIRSFDLLAQDADIIYSTHSHYLINPHWLESTHIVQNSASEKPSDDFDTSPIHFCPVKIKG